MRRIAITAVTLAALALPAAASATNDKATEVDVMSRKVYLGADLGPAIDAPDLNSAIDAAAVIYREVEATNFPERAVPLAKEINDAQPDLVGLQEVALWREQIPSDGGSPPSGVGEPATTVKYDFLQLLMDELDATGSKYRVVGVQEEFDAELPVDLDGSDSTGFLGGDLDARLTMRDVILARKGVTTKGLKKGHFETRYEPVIGGAVTLPVDRGWLSTEATVDGAKFRFVNTHLEAFGEPTIREAQAKELVAKGGPAKSKKDVVLIGDFNSDDDSVKGDDRLAYAALTKAGFLERQAAAFACCYPSMTDPSLKFDHQVDHVLVNSKKIGLAKKKSFVTGNDKGEMTPSGLWPSDHGGVFSALLFP
ncbi:MAG: endonuclease/exonuclease/phosphatase family protein [Solirubrobacterales bacterium]